MVTWPKCDFKIMSYLFLEQILHLNFKEIVEKMLWQRFQHIWA